jgi:carboxyl-terminal processing protease
VNDKIIAVAQGDAAPEDIIDVPLRDAVSRIRGKKGTTVKLTIVRTDPKTKSERTIIIPVVRDDVVLEDSAIKHAIYEQKTGKKTHTIGYIKFPTFYASFKNGQRFCSKDLFDSIKSLKASGVDSIVVDLRGNPGGALTEAIRTAGFFIKSGPVVQVKYSENIDIHRDTDPAVYWDGPLVVLIDKLSASASEIFAGAIRDYNRGLIIGPSKTFGKGTVQDLRDLGGNGAIKVTIQLFYQPSGTSNNMNGIEPNIYVPDLIQLYDYDESKMKFPLTWKPIPRADFKAYNTEYISPFIVSTLDRATRARRRNDPQFKTLEEKIEKYRKQVETKQVSLKKRVDGSGDYEEEIEKRGDAGEKEKAVFNLDKDLFLKEAFRITGDYVDALRK